MNLKISLFSLVLFFLSTMALLVSFRKSRNTKKPTYIGDSWGILLHVYLPYYAFVVIILENAFKTLLFISITPGKTCYCDRPMRVWICVNNNLWASYYFVCLPACSPEMEAPYSSDEEKMRLLDLYRYMHSRIHSTSRPLKLIYHVAERETLLAWVSSCALGYCSHA